MALKMSTTFVYKCKTILFLSVSVLRIFSTYHLGSHCYCNNYQWLCHLFHWLCYYLWRCCSYCQRFDHFHDASLTFSLTFFKQTNPSELLISHSTVLFLSVFRRLSKFVTRINYYVFFFVYGFFPSLRYTLFTSFLIMFWFTIQRWYLGWMFAIHSEHTFFFLKTKKKNKTFKILIVRGIEAKYFASVDGAFFVYAKYGTFDNAENYKISRVLNQNVTICWGRLEIIAIYIECIENES